MRLGDLRQIALVSQGSRCLVEPRESISGRCRMILDDLGLPVRYRYPQQYPLREAAVKDVGADCRRDSGSIACTDAPDDQPGILTTAVIKPHSQFIL
jgi:hypothetical protein